MFNLKVTEDEIQATLKQLEKNVYPNSASLDELTFYIFNYADTIDNEFEIADYTDIDRRKVRLCITELRKRGHLIIGERGYSMAGDDPAPVIEFINKMYSRANNITKSTDIMFHGLKQKYGDSVSEKVQALPWQPELGGFIDVMQVKPIGYETCEQPFSMTITPNVNMQSEPPFRKSYTREGIENQFQADA